MAIIKAPIQCRIQPALRLHHRLHLSHTVASILVLHEKTILDCSVLQYRRQLGKRWNNVVHTMRCLADLNIDTRPP